MLPAIVVIAVLIVDGMAAGATVLPTVPGAMDGMRQAREQPQRERGVCAGQMRAACADDVIRYICNADSDHEQQQRRC